MNQDLRIALMGTAGVGKSTTARMLHEHTGIELHSELESRLIKNLIRKGIIKDKYSFSPEQSKQFQNKSLSIRERLASRNSFISDRTAGELWVYHQIYCGPHSTQEELDKFKERCYHVMKRYTHLFLFPFGIIPLVDNNYRNTNAEYQHRVRGLIEKMLSEFKLRYIRLEEKAKTKEERFQEVLSWIQKA